MNKPFATFALIFHLAYVNVVFAYEILTHEDLAQKAFIASVLQEDDGVLSSLGLRPLLEDQKFPNVDGELQTISQLLRYGANQEDNLYIPAVGGSRFMHHFYDPVHNIPLTDFTPFNLEFVSLRYGVPYQPIQKSPNWALEDNGDFLDNKYAGQTFSYKDARGYFFKALTAFSRADRDQYFGLMFQTLGHVIHHIQDMGQPQHVKNEQHPPIAPSSLYEHYTNRDEVRTRLPFIGYAPVYSLKDDHTTFDAPAKFWATGNGQGKGLAEFTNFNFVTYGHNFVGTLAQPQANPVYPNPQPIGFGERAVIDLPLAPQAGLDQAALDGKMYFIKAPVADAYRPSEARINNLASAFSLYDDDLTRWNIHLDCPPGSIIDPSVQCTQQAVFTVNRFTMSAAHDFLIPRAVGYSAGLINYFFRGKLSVDSQTQLGRLVVKNEGPDTISGHFTLYYDDAEDHRYAVVPDPENSIGATPWPTPAEGLLPGQTITLPAFTPPPTGLRPMPKTPGEYMLVFQGTMGQEQGIAVAAKKVQGSVPPSFLTPTGRLQYTTSGWQVMPDTTLQYGNVDWQGPTPEDVVTWIGPRGRLVNKLLVTQLSNKIFQHGSVLVEAPGPVLGAALSTQSKLGLGNSDQKMVVAVIAVTEPGGGTIVGYDPQANTPVYSSQPIVVRDDVYVKPVDAASSQGWQLIGSYEYPSIDYYRSPLQSSRPDHWFFNADGNAAVCNKLTQTAFITGGIRRPYRPIKLTVSSGSAAFTDIAESDPELLQTSAAETFTLTDAYVDYKGNEIIKLSITVSLSASDDATSFTKDMTLARLGRTYRLVDYASAAGDWRSQWNIEHIDLRTGLIAYRDIHLDVVQGGFNTFMQVYYITQDGSQVLVGSPSLSDEYYLSWAHLAYAYIDASAFLLNGNSFNEIANLGESLPEEIFDPERGIGSVAIRLPLNGSTSQNSGQAIISQSVVDFSTPVLQKTSLIPPTGALPGGLGDFITPIGIE